MDQVDLERIKLSSESERARAFLAYFFRQEAYRDQITLTCSLQKDGIVLMDLMRSINIKCRVVFLQTGRHFQETIDFLQEVERFFEITIERVEPEWEKIEQMVAQKGEDLFYESVENRKLCCHLRKVEPMGRALKGQKVWISGLRRDQSPSRQNLQSVDFDPNHGVIKISPLAEWSQAQIDRYIADRNLPIHPLYARGFTSIGCEPCTRAIQPGEDDRAGRWWWEQGSQKECGLHPPIDYVI